MTPDWAFQLLWFGAGIGGTGAVWYFLSQRQFHTALWSGFAAAVIVCLAIALHIRNDLLRAQTATTEQAATKEHDGNALRQLGIDFSIPAVGSPIEAVVAWENVSNRNIVLHGHATVYTIGLAEDEQLPIRPETEDAFEGFGRQQQATGPPRDNSTEIPAGTRVLTRHTSDPSKPLTEKDVAELRSGRARVYVVGEERWTIEGVEHGCDYCAWTAGDGRAILGRRGNRCF